MAHRLELDRVSVRFGEKQLLKEVSLTITRGQITALGGRSGSGKSLCALTLQGLLPPNLTLDSGQILLDNIPISGEEVKKSCAIIMQAPRTCFNPIYTMKTHILETLRAREKLETHARGFLVSHRMYGVQKSLQYGEILSRVLMLFERLGLEERVLACYAHELSGGMLQRVMIVIALLSGAEFLICDEGTSDLDSLCAREILHLLRELCQNPTPHTTAPNAKHTMQNSDESTKGLGVLLITHDRTLMRESDMCYGIDSGKISAHTEHISLAHHDARQIITSPATSQTPTLPPSLPHQNLAQTSSPARIQTTPIISLHALCKSYPSKPQSLLPSFGSKKQSLATNVLDSLSLQIMQGEKVAIIGRSGSGKSTLARIIARLEPYDSGELIYTPSHTQESSQISHTAPRRSASTGHRPKTHAKSSRMSLRARRGFYQEVQLLFQDPLSAFNPRKIIWESLAQGLRTLLGIHDTSAQEQIIFPLCAQLELDRGLLFVYPSMLSGGQAARMNLIRALCIDPALLILDEATSALDFALEERVWSYLDHGVDSGSFLDRNSYIPQKPHKNLNISPESTPKPSIHTSKKHKSLLFITHDIALARRHCDRIILLDSGQIIESVGAREGFTSDLGRALEPKPNPA